MPSDICHEEGNNFSGAVAASRLDLSPRICVVMPAYKAADTIVKAIQSVLNQKYPNLVVAVAVPSHDVDTLTAAREIGDKQILLLEQSGRGIADARNLVLKNVSADLYMFLDSDDFMKPDVVERYVAHRLATGKAALRCGHYTELALNSSQPEWTRRCPLTGKIQNGFGHLALLNFIGTGSVMIDREIVTKVGYFDTRFSHGEDWHYWLRISKCFPIFVLDVVAYRYTYAKLSRQRPFPRSFFDDGVRVIRDVNPPWYIEVCSVMCIKSMAALYYFRTLGSRNSLKQLLDCRLSDIFALPFAAVILFLRKRACL